MSGALKKATTGIMVCFSLLLLNEGMAQSPKSESLSKTESSAERLENLQLKVEGMSCQLGCANGIDKMLKEKAGILESRTIFDYRLF